ncbi:hypothetical protein KY362_07750 [Candidatus Woesearchaeota archaeon]|nr:hypothetical protein [Candidatus Woesearchaeota archaeon]
MTKKGHVRKKSGKRQSSMRRQSKAKTKAGHAKKKIHLPARRVRRSRSHAYADTAAPDTLSPKTLAIIIICMTLLTIGAVLLFFAEYVIYKAYDVPMEIEVAETTGFNADTDYLNFGKARPLNSNQRTIVMSHSYQDALRVHFRITGNISQFVITPDDFFLEPEQNKEVAFTAEIPEGTALGEYTGNLRVYFRRI